ncbi:hypothetical protein Hanom_Chr05g00446771 [Helianthus anomalus]
MAKVGSERKDPTEKEEDSFEAERQIHEFVIERFICLKAHQDKILVEAEENLADLRSIALAKDKAITMLEKVKK